MPIQKDSPHKTAEPLPLRPHHLLCTEFFKGYGYSDGFSANMSDVISMLNADDPAVTLTAGTDVICRGCPHNKGGICDSREKVRRYDLAVLELLEVHEGGTAAWSELKRSARERIIAAGKLYQICGDCQWFHICGK